MDFAACPVRHSPQYYCCEYSESTKVLYTKFNRPSGGDYESYYVDGWNKQRQVNFPYTMYHPSTPTFYYDDPSTMCRVHAVANTETGELTEELQCTDTNSSLVEASQDSSVFWTYAANVRNNNATFPVGANCYSLMLRDGSVSTYLKNECTSKPTALETPTIRFTTFTEAPLVIIYLVYLVFLLLLGAWTLYKRHFQTCKQPADGIDKKLLGTPAVLTKPLADDACGRRTSVRPSAVHMQLTACEGVLQTGYSKSWLGTFVFGCLVVASVGLNVLLIVIIFDLYRFFDPPLFDASEDNTAAFFVVWVAMFVWFVVIMVLQDRIFNFFRLRVPLDNCEFVYMLKRDDTEVLLADRSGVSDYVAKVEAFFASKGKLSGYRATVPVMQVDGLRIVEFQHLRYVYEESEQRFVPGAVALGRTYEDMQHESSGLSDSEAKHRINTVGPNSVDVEMPSLPVSMAREFFTLFYIYQIMCYYVWYYFTYWNMGIVMTVVVLGAAIVNIYTQRQIQSSIVQMTRYRTNVTVFRDGAWREMSSPDIAPGDLVKVSENWVVPCDMAIVKGTTVCDESMLTGESMPVQKFPIPERGAEVYDPEKSGKKHTLFAGTRVLSSGRNEEILAVVQTTGAHTTKGQLIQSILFPIPMRFKYNEHLKVLITLLLIYAIIACIAVVNFLMSNGKLSNRYAAFCYAIFVLSCVISPLLPVVITVGQVNASQRLEKQGIFSLNVQRITLCGKVRIFCFDKTGTLTKQGLDFLGVQPVSNNLFVPIVNDIKDAPSSEELLYALATCHSVGSLEDRLVGNEVEVRMFTATGWELVEKEGEQPCVKSKVDPGLELEFIKRYDFDHHRMSMSVVVRNRKSGKYYVFCKGSYERMQQLSAASSVPGDYKSVADRLAKDGCYVLGLSYRELPSDWTHEQVVAFADNRDAVDESLSLLGLILFRNELKDDTADAIAKLKGGDVRTVMITGDNAMCGCYIARQSGMVASSSRVILGEMVSTTHAKTLVWRDVDSEEEYDLPAVKHLVEQGEDVELAVTGVAFDYLVSMGEIKELLLHIRIFSRMTPDGKVECVKLHMETGSTL
ncbi:Polyamine-transporting ATPase 13A2 [Phytophthora ramorum]|uniref:Polyamine-transporting ATPase 13A2 n=1 Tax=Phytophthora ramorum TaxID=164328 RepID=UPI0030A35CAD|nr:Polyamine-transporting ATPase 13A2 [Phytophthora ramorum]